MLEGSLSRWTRCGQSPLTFATYQQLARPRAGSIQSLHAGSPAPGRLLLESASTQCRSLEGRPLAMYSSLMLPDRPTLRLLYPRPRLAAAFGEQRRPMSGLNERREPP
jgi:hypothetical protein